MELNFIFEIFSFLGGLAFFLYGMNVMSDGLEKTAGGKLEYILKKITSNKYKALLLGLVITMVIQSSSAMTVMLVGLVNSGIMTLNQSIGVIMGSNIGTTVTAWILSLAGLEGDNFLIRFLKPDSFAPLLAFIGIAMIMLCKTEKKKEAGKILVGFGVLMFGMDVMSSAVEPLKENEAFKNILIAFSNPLIGVLTGTVFTGIIQSSSASVGILQALSMTGQITYGMAIPIIMGQNIGTCVTSLLSSIGVNKNAKKVAVVHITFNLIGTLVFLILFYVCDAVINFAFVDTAINPFNIAIVHTIFNVATTFMLFPFTKQLEKIANKIIRSDESPEKTELIDQRLLNAPSLAILRCRELTIDMCNIAKDAILSSTKLLDNFDAKIAADIEYKEKETDNYEDKLGSYLVKLSRKSLSVYESHMSSLLLNSIGDIERISDHALNIVKSAKEINDKNIRFSNEGNNELRTMCNALCEIMELTYSAFETDDTEIAKRVEPLEQVIDGLKQSLKNSHIQRLQQGNCTIETGFVFNDLITNFERVADHCSNIAACIIQIKRDNLETHEYLNHIKNLGNSEFRALYDEYQNKYAVK